MILLDITRTNKYVSYNVKYVRNSFTACIISKCQGHDDIEQRDMVGVNTALSCINRCFQFIRESDIDMPQLYSLFHLFLG